MTAQANMLPEYARTVDDINDASTTQKGVRLAAINKNRNMTLRMSRIAR
jgi:hypothetical protein